MKKQPKKPVKNREQYPYVVFQIDRKVRERLRRKTAKMNTSMSQFVADLIQKAV